MFDLVALRQEGGFVWAGDAKLRATLRDDRDAWIRRVSKLEYAPRAGSSESDMVRGLRDSIVNTRAGAPGLNTLPAHLLARVTAEPAAAATTVAPAAAATGHTPAGVGYETEDHERALAAAAFHANTPAGAKLRSDFAGNLGTYLAYDKATRDGRARVFGGGVETFKGGRHA